MRIGGRRHALPELNLEGRSA